MVYVNYLFWISSRARSDMIPNQFYLDEEIKYYIAVEYLRTTPN